MNDTIDSLIIVNQLLLVISGISVFILLLTSTVLTGNKNTNKNLKKSWLLFPIILTAIFFFTNIYLKKYFNKEITKELIEKLDKSGKVLIPNSTIILDKQKIKPVNHDRYTSDLVFELELHDYYFIRLERTLEDSNKYWVFVEKYKSTSGDDPVAIFNSK